MQKTKHGFVTPEYGDPAAVPAVIQVNNEAVEHALDEVEKAIGEASSEITIDAELSETSTNPVQNKVIAEAIKKKQDKLTIDDELSDTSENPIQNKTVAAAVKDIKTTLGTMSDLLDSVNGA